MTMEIPVSGAVQGCISYFNLPADSFSKTATYSRVFREYTINVIFYTINGDELRSSFSIPKEEIELVNDRNYFLFLSYKKVTKELLEKALEDYN